MSKTVRTCFENLWSVNKRGINKQIKTKTVVRKTKDPLSSFP